MHTSLSDATPEPEVSSHAPTQDKQFQTFSRWLLGQLNFYTSLQATGFLAEQALMLLLGLHFKIEEFK